MFQNCWDVAALYLRSQRVIGLRAAVISRGGQNAHDEALHMVTKKIFAAGQACEMILAGSGGMVLGYYDSLVAANVKRLETSATGLPIV